MLAVRSTWTQEQKLAVKQDPLKVKHLLASLSSSCRFVAAVLLQSCQMFCLILSAAAGHNSQFSALTTCYGPAGLTNWLPLLLLMVLLHCAILVILKTKTVALNILCIFFKCSYRFCRRAFSLYYCVHTTYRQKVSWQSIYMHNTYLHFLKRFYCQVTKNI